MPNRLARFRAVHRALDPTRTPSAALSSQTWVAPPGDVAAKLARTLSLAPESTSLLLGPVGSGKTTTMLRVAEQLGPEALEEGDKVTYVDVGEHHDLDAKLTGVLVALAGKTFIGAEGPTSDAGWELRRHADSYSEWTEAYVDEGPDWPYVEAPNVGVIVPPASKLTLGHLVEPLRKLRGPHPAVFLFDSLDRLSDPRRFADAVIDDLRALKAAGIGVVVAGPLRYTLEAGSSIRDLFDRQMLIPTPDPETEDGLRFLADVLARRTPEDPFSDEVRQLLAKASGGGLRDLVGLARSALEEAYTSGASAVEPPHVQAAASALGDAMAFGLDDTQVSTLRALLDSGAFVIRGEAELALLDRSRVIIRDQTRFEVHPCLRARLTSSRIAA